MLICINAKSRNITYFKLVKKEVRIVFSHLTMCSSHIMFLVVSYLRAMPIILFYYLLCYSTVVCGCVCVSALVCVHVVYLCACLCACVSYLSDSSIFITGLKLHAALHSRCHSCKPSNRLKLVLSSGCTRRGIKIFANNSPHLLWTRWNLS